MNKKQNGIIIAVIGIAIIIISQTVKFTTTTSSNEGFGVRFVSEQENTILKNTVLFSGIALLILGSIVFAKGLGGKEELSSLLSENNTQLKSDNDKTIQNPKENNVKTYKSNTITFRHKATNNVDTVDLDYWAKMIKIYGEDKYEIIEIHK